MDPGGAGTGLGSLGGGGCPGDPRSPVALGTCRRLSAAGGNQLKETLDLLYSPARPFFSYPVTSLSVLRFVVVVFQEIDDFVFYFVRV